MVASLELAQRLDRAEAMAGAAFVDARRAHFPESGAEWRELGGAIALFDGPDSPVTQVFGLGLSQPVTAELLQSLEDFFTERGAPTDHDLSPLGGVPAAALLARRGYVPIEYSNVLCQSLDGWAPVPAASGIQVHRVSEREAGVWAETGARGWSDVFAFPGLVELNRMIAAREGACCFLATIGGSPVAAGALFVHQRVALLAGASTVPAARRRGAQFALLQARLRFARDLGCDLAMMCAEPGSASQRNAGRNGFHIAYTRTKWRLAAALH